jgi:hypothetical protein
MEAKLTPGSKILYRWERSPKATLLAVLVPSYKGQPRFDVREWTPIGGSLSPTKRGLSLKREELPKLRESDKMRLVS